MINTEDTLYPKDKPLSKQALLANKMYYEALAKRASKQYRDAIGNVTDIISIELTKKTDLKKVI